MTLFHFYRDTGIIKRRKSFLGAMLSQHLTIISKTVGIFAKQNIVDLIVSNQFFLKICLKINVVNITNITTTISSTKSE